jgi:HECT-domain (ubiquitin-transferase)
LIESYKSIRNSIPEEEFLSAFELYFTTILSNSEEVELCHGGKHKRVNYSNLEDYIKKTVDFRLHECKEQIKHIKKGIDITFNSHYLRLLSWKDLQYKVVG